jgi:hypothetical protein
LTAVDERAEPAFLCPRLPKYPGALGNYVQLGPDYRFIRNPGFNHQRGPVYFFALRVHAEYRRCTAVSSNPRARSQPSSMLSGVLV